MLFFYLAFLIAGVCEAVSLSNGKITLGGRKSLGFGAEPAALDVIDRDIDVSFQILDDEASVLSPPVPHQVAVIFGSEDLPSAQQYIYPKWVASASGYDALLPLKGLSPFLKQQKSISVSVLLGDADSANNLVEQVATFLPTKKLLADVKTELPARFGEKKQIFHHFASPPTQAPAPVSNAFVVLAVLTLGALIYVWTTSKASNFDNASKVTPLAGPFVLCLAIFEAVFYSYYLGTSIFKTLERVAIVTVAAVYFGSKVLRSLCTLREAGQR